MSNIGTRIEVEKNADSVQVTIRAYRENSKQSFLLVWVLFWTACGIYILSQLFGGGLPEDLRTFFIIWGGFWAYFEYKAVYAYRWRNWGKEVIEIRENRMSLWRLVGKRGIPRHYSLDFIKDLRLLEDSSNSFVRTMNNSYWVVGGETIGFDYQGKLVGFGLQLDQKDASALSSLLKHEVRERRQD